MILTDKDYQLLEPIAVFHFKQTFTLECFQKNLESKRFRRRLVEVMLFEADSSFDLTVEDAKEFEEFEKKAKQAETEGDDLFSGISRIFSLYSWITDKITKLKKKSGIHYWIFAAILGKISANRRLYEELVSLEEKRKLLDKARLILSKKLGKPPEKISSSEVAKMARKLVVVNKKAEILSNAKKLNALGGWYNKTKAFFLKIWSKLFPENIALQLDKTIEFTLKWASKHKLWSGLIVIGTIALILITIFRWNTIKRIFKAIVRFITAPFRLFLKGLTWFFSLIKRIFFRGEKNETKDYFRMESY